MSKTYELSYTAERIDEMLKEVDEHTIYSDATTEEHGLMSATDKTKLDALPTAQQIDGALSEKVDKVEGKGLSTNDYTDDEKESVASAYHKPQNGIPKTDLDSSVQTSLDKADTALQSFTEADPTVPSWAKQQNKPLYDYSEIVNTPDLSGFITKSVNDLTNYYLKSETYTRAEVAALIGAIQQFHYEIYSTLPSSGESNVLYLIGPTGSGSDKYEEYVYANNVWNKIGDTSIDLSGYVTTSALNTALADYTTTSNLTALLSNKADKVSNATNGNFAGLDANGNLTDSGSKASDFATASQGAKADTAYQKPQPGIPESDLSSYVQQALQKHFKGWLTSTSQLPSNPVVGDYAYVEDNGTTYIYRCSTNGEWPTTSTEEKEPADVTFADGQEVNEVHIVNDFTTGGVDDVLSAEQGKLLGFKIVGNYPFEINILSDGEHSSTIDKVNVFIPAGSKFNIKVANGTSTTSGSLVPYVTYRGEDSHTPLVSINSVPGNKDYIAAKDIIDIGFYIANAKAGTILFTIHNYGSLEDSIAENSTNIEKNTLALEALNEKSVAVIPIVDQNFNASNSLQTVYPANSLEVGARYRLEINSDGITFDSDAFTGTNILSYQGGGIPIIEYSKNNSIEFPIINEFNGTSSRIQINCLRCHDNESINIKLYKLADAENRIIDLKKKTEGLENLNEKISIIPLFSDEYIRKGSLSSYKIVDGSYFEVGESYRLELSSDTGITWDNTTYPSITNVIEIGAVGGFSNVGGTLYTLTKSQTFEPINIEFTVNTVGGIYMYISRYLSTEKLKVKLYKLGSIEKQLIGKETIEIIHKDALEVVNTAKNHYNKYSANGENWHIAILQMTDTHTDWKAVDRCFELANLKHDYGNAEPEHYFDVLIHSGDIVEGNADLTTDNWVNRVLACDIPTLAIPGNHEMEYIAGSNYHKEFTDTDVYTKIYGNGSVPTYTGEIHHVIDGMTQNYFYKDVTKNGVTIRIICLYQYEWDVPRTQDDKPMYGDSEGKDMVLYSQAQIDWFVDTLKDAAANGYGVIVVSHSPISQYDIVDCPFSEDKDMPNIPNGTGSMAAFLSNKYFFCEIIDAFVNGGACNTSSSQIPMSKGEDPEPIDVDHPISVNTTFTTAGKFICNICGHHHRGEIMKMVKRGEGQDAPDVLTDYPIIMAPTSSSNEGQNYGSWSRTETRTKDCLNVIIYDSLRDKIKIVRIGANVSNRMMDARFYMM